MENEENVENRKIPSLTIISYTVQINNKSYLGMIRGKRFTIKTIIPLGRKLMEKQEKKYRRSMNYGKQR